MYTQNLCVDVPISIELRFGIWKYTLLMASMGHDHMFKKSNIYDTKKVHEITKRLMGDLKMMR